MALVRELVHQRRFKFLLVGLLIMGLMLGLLIVPIESRHPNALILTWFDGLWWAATTITSVGYGDFYPVTHTGKLIGVALEVVGVLAFGLLIGMVTVALDERKNRFYWQRMFEWMDRLEKKLEQAEKRDDFVVKQVAENEDNNS